MSNYTIFGSTTGGGATLSTVLKNISNTTLPNDEQLLVVEDDGIVAPVPISTYGKTLLNSISLAQLKADLDGSPTAVSVNDSGTGEVNITVDGDTNLRLQVKNTETNLYNELKIHNGAVNGGLKMNSTTLETKSNNGKVLVEGVVNGVELKKAGNMILNGTSDNLTLHKPSNGDAKMTIGGNVDFVTNIIGTGHDIGASGFNWDNVYSNTNNSNNYTIIDGGFISMVGTQILRFLNGTGYNLTNTYLFQLASGKKTRFSQNGLLSNFLEIDTASNNIHIGETGHTTKLNTCDILPLQDSTYDIGTTDIRYDNLFIDQGNVGGIAISSDRTLKNSIETSDLGLSFINELTPVKYKYNNKKRIHYGLIAQELREVLGSDNISMWGIEKQSQKQFIQYMELICPVIKAVQELDKKFEDNLNIKQVVLEGVEKLKTQPQKPQQEDEFSNIKNLLKSMAKPEIKQEEKPVVLENENYEQQLESLNIKHKILNEKHNSLLGQVEELKQVLQSKPEEEEEEVESDNGNSVLDIIQKRLYELEKRCTKNENKLKKLTTIINKLAKQ